MPQIRITMTIDDEQADADDPTGMTEEAYADLADSLGEHGSDIKIVSA